MNKRIAFCFATAFVSIFVLAACGGGDEEQKEAQQEQQEPTQQQKTQQEPTQQQKTQQEPTQPAAQSPPSIAQLDELAAQLVGTWDATSIQDSPVPPGTQTLVFSEDGTLRTIYDDGTSSTDTTTQYTVLDDSRIEGIDPDGTPVVANYSLEGDTLTLDSQGVPATYQRTG